MLLFHMQGNALTSAEKKSKPENCLMWKRHSLMWTLINLYIVGNWAKIFNVKKLVKC